MISNKPEFNPDPKRQADQPSFVKKEDQVPMVSGSGNAQRHLSILIVDDDSGTVKITSRMLQSIGQTNLTSFDNRNNAIDWLKGQKDNGAAIDVLFSDYLMPEMGYIEFRKVALELFPNIKIILMSGTMGQASADGAEANAYLIKPFDLDQFKSKFEQVLSGKDELPPTE